ncbi:hypothetical protein WG66_016712 [Moniliophthora roreri]|nr:hypothetical protein WG66_016712 [Moniliophthora roreri]
METYLKESKRDPGVKDLRTTAHYAERKVQHLACKLKLLFDDNHNTLFPWGYDVSPIGWFNS